MLREEIYRQTITIFQSLKIQKGNDDVVACKLYASIYIRITFDFEWLRFTYEQ